MKIKEKDGKFVIVDFDEREAYQISCCIEKDGIQFYRDIAQKERNPQARKTLEFLVADEQCHLKFFEERLRELESTDDRDADNDVLDSLDYGVFHPYDQIKKLAAAVKDSKTALKLAVKIEDKSLQFYEACRRLVSSEKTKQQLQHVIEEEQRHREVLRSLLSGLP